MMLIFAGGGFSFGGLALHGHSLVEYGIGWAIVFLMVGFFEEFLFRGYLQFTLSTAIGFWPSAILLSIVFGFVHLGSLGENWMGAVTAGLFGLFLCLMSYVTTNGQPVVRVRAARQLCVRRNIHLFGPEQRVSLVRALAQFHTGHDG